MPWKNLPPERHWYVFDEEYRVLHREPTWRECLNWCHAAADSVMILSGHKKRPDGVYIYQIGHFENFRTFLIAPGLIAQKVGCDITAEPKEDPAKPYPAG